MTGVSETEAGMPVSNNRQGVDAGLTKLFSPLLRAPKPLFDVRLISSRELLELPMPPKQHLLVPWIPEKGLGLVYAPRGVGKTLFGLSIAYAVASGGEFLRWRAPRPRHVLYIDGEMPLETMRERLAAIENGSEKKVDADFLRFLCADALEGEMIDLGRSFARRELEPHLDGIDLIIVDNVSTVVRSVAESDGDSWKPVQEWALRQRRANRSVLFVHHANKRGGPRGTSRREDVVDTVISLTRPADYQSTEGARFVIQFEKARGFVGEDAEPFEARYETIDGAARWTWTPVVDEAYERASELFEAGKPVRAVAAELGISKSTAGRLRQQWQAEANDEDEEEDQEETA
jgi:putative DNA primase/helicase